MSAICHNFVQNAWKKELCSNCFKSKDEHVAMKKTRSVVISSVPKIILLPAKHSILKTKSNKKSGKKSVCFQPQIAHVIGYGGEDVFSSDDDATESDHSDSPVEEEVSSSGDDERELRKLTKANTDFNMLNRNLLGEGESTKKSYAQLMLGKPQTGADGRKQTLLVSVTPFGQDSVAVRKSRAISHIPLSKNKDSLVDNKNNVILTAFTKSEDLPKEEKSLLDEISETLEKGSNHIQIIAKKKVQNESNGKDDVDSSLTSCNNVNNSSSKLKNGVTAVVESNGVNEDDSSANKTPVTEPRKNGLTRNAAIKKDEKPFVYQTAFTKIELYNNKNNRLSQESLLKAKSEAGETKDTLKEDCIVDNNQNVTYVDKTKLSVELPMPIIAPMTTLADDKDSHSSLSSTKSDLDSGDDVEKVLGLPPPVPRIVNGIPESREQAGEPDGRADPEVNLEPPALPLTPPPAESRTSFLHNVVHAFEKPKVPNKPSMVLIRKSIQLTPTPENVQPCLSTFAAEPSKATTPSDLDALGVKLTKQDSNGSDVPRTPNKRRAPRPPQNEESGTIYMRNSAIVTNSDSPVVREKEKRERASSCSPKLRPEVSENPDGVVYENASVIPEPAPRRSLSLSQDSLASLSNEDCKTKKDKSTKGRFSLKKFLRISSNKELPKLPSEIPKIPEDYRMDPNAPQPKPRLVIVHPSELNGAKVEVVPKSHTDELQNVTDRGDIYAQRPPQPPPPPRSNNPSSKPVVPASKSSEIIHKQKNFSKMYPTPKPPTESVYANIGEVRAAIAPSKPQRTASMREREEKLELQMRRNNNNNNKVNNNYEQININTAAQSKDANENVYDYINNSGSARSSSPECDSSSSPEKNSPTSTVKVPRCKRNGNHQHQRKSDGSLDANSEYYKFQTLPRSTSMTYCGSETESEIYSPYSFYGSESEITEDDHDWTTNGRTCKLRSRKGRSIVHKNLEDNYGAVVVANHEALAQVLENIQQGVNAQPALRGLKLASSLRWNDFTVADNIPAVVLGHRSFYQALWGTQHVTLMISAGSLHPSPLSLGSCGLVPVTEFCDLIPVNYVLNSANNPDAQQIQGTVAVLPWLQINTVEMYRETIRAKDSNCNADEIWKEAGFVLLQLINALKTLQAQGIEEVPLNLTRFILTRDFDKETHQRLCVLQGIGDETSQNDEEKTVTLCACANAVLKELLPNAKLTPLLGQLLSTERAVSLSQVKSVIEFSLWGPSDVNLGTSLRDRDLALQHWLDLQRATVLHGLVCTRVQLSVYEECHLLFLVRSNSKMMSDASLLLESNHAQQNGRKAIA